MKFASWTRSSSRYPSVVRNEFSATRFEIVGFCRRVRVDVPFTDDIVGLREQIGKVLDENVDEMPHFRRERDVRRLLEMGQDGEEFFDERLVEPAGRCTAP